MKTIGVAFLVLVCHLCFAQNQGDITVSWRGADTARIQVGPVQIVYPPNSDRNLNVPANDNLLVQVRARGSVYHADRYLTVQPGKGHVYIELSGKNVVMKYIAGTRLKACLGDIESNMVLVKSGSFTMGNEKGDVNEKPAHAVKLKSFYISRYEITHDQWKALVGTDTGYFKNCPDCPVENIGWEAAMHFISRLNEQSGKKYRLPTEAEWEYAARGGIESAGNTYSGSNTLNDIAWYYINSKKQPHPVGTKMPNELGLYDMTGNVWEWCSDWYSEDYYHQSPTDNPKGPANGDMHILRGGSWFDFDIECRNTFRFRPLSDYRMYILGFRLAMDAE